MTIYIIEGIDRIGKSTLIKNIINNEGFHNRIHYEKPMKAKYYNEDLRSYQFYSFVQGFDLIKNSTQTTNIIFDRFHLGEVVYSPMYRGYKGDYVYDLEKNYSKYFDDVRLVLLVAPDLDIITDDGESHDYNNRGVEQDAFIDAFYRSAIPDKRIVHVTDNGNFLPEDQIYKAATHSQFSIENMYARTSRV